MLVDSGSEEHVFFFASWKRLGEPSLNPSHVRVHSATGDVMGVTGSISVSGWCGDQPVVLSAQLVQPDLFVCAETYVCWIWIRNEAVPRTWQERVTSKKWQVR